MDSKSKILVQNSELSNLYEDIAKDILKNLVFDSSHENQVNQLLFIYKANIPKLTLHVFETYPL